MPSVPEVTILQRRSGAGQFSIERCFAQVVATLRGKGRPVRLKIAPVFSRGVLRRLRILAFARRLNADIVHINGDIMFAALATVPQKTVVTVHDCEILERSSRLQRWLISTFWFRLPLRRAAAVTVISTSTRDALLRHFPELDQSRLHIIPTATPDNFEYEPKNAMPQRPRILQIGTKPNKNLPRLIAALEGLDVELVVVGRLESALAARLEQSGLRHVTKYDLSDDDLRSEYRKADIVTLVSLDEGFGMPIVEAQRAGRPIVTSNCSSMPEVAGEGAVLVEPLDPRAIRSAIVRLIEDPDYRAEIVRRGQQNAVRFRNDAIAEHYWRIYETVHRSASVSGPGKRIVDRAKVA